MNFEKRSIRIFISSTFKDMMPEREYLMKVIFPELRKRCKKKFVDITEVDLRWGILPEESKEGKVIDICLSEIDKSRPYFIGLLGGRYGWIPSKEEYEKHVKIIENFPWVKQDIEAGLSITEMEIQYGVLRNAKMNGRAFFYLKEIPGMVKDEENTAQLDRLKEKIKKQSAYPVHAYHSAEELGQLILEQLWAQISKEFPDEDIPDAHKLENLNQLCFLRSHLDHYMDPDQLLESLEAQLNSHQKLVIHAENGQGKSALLANWIQSQWENKNILPYLCGSTTDSSQLEKMVGHIARELKNRFNISLSIPKKIESPRSLLQAFLNETDPSEKIYLVIDGIDSLQADPANLQLRWLPEDIPENVHIILSTSRVEEIEILKTVGFQTFELKQLAPKTVRNIAENYFHSYSKKLPADLLDKLSKAPINAKPVVLLTLVNELRLFGTHEELPNQISYYTQQENTSDFFQAFLERLEKDFPNEKFKLDAVLSILQLSAQGLTETEIVEISGLSKLNWSILYNILDYHFINKNGLIQVSNTFLQEAIRKRYLSDEKNKNQQLTKLVDYFLEDFAGFDLHTDQENQIRVVEELPKLLYQLRDVNRLKQVLTFLPVFESLFEKNYQNLAKYLGYLRSHFDLGSLLLNAVKKVCKEEIEAERKIRLSFYAGHALFAHDDPARAIPVFYQALEVFNQSKCKNSLVLEVLKELSAIYSRLGMHDKAAFILENLLPYEQEEGTAEIFDLLSQLYSSRGDFTKAKTLNRDALEYSVDRYGILDVRVAILYNNLGRIFDRQTDFEQAKEQYAQAARIAEKIGGKTDPLYLSSKSNLALIAQKSHQHEEAWEEFMSIYEIRKSSLGLKHPLTLKTTNSLGVTKSLMGELEEAASWLNQAYAGQLEVLGENHSDSLVTLANIADLHLKQENYPEGEKVQRRVFETSVEIYGELNEYSINAGLALADSIYKLGKSDEAVEQFQKMIPILTQYYGEGHEMVLYTRYKVSQINIKREKTGGEDLKALIEWELYVARHKLNEENLEEAENHFLLVHNVSLQVFKGTNPEYFSALEGLAALYFQWNKYQKAVGYCDKLIELAREAMGEESSAFLRFNVIRAYNLYKAGDYQNALPALVKLGKSHETLLNFEEKITVKMYQELVDFFNRYQLVLANYRNNMEEADRLYKETSSLFTKTYEEAEAEQASETLEKVEKIIETALFLNKEYAQPFPSIFYFKAETLEGLGRIKDAITALMDGLNYVTYWEHDFNPGTEPFAIKLATLLSHLERDEEAMFFFNRAEKVNRNRKNYPDENSITIQSGLLMLHLRNGKHTKAMKLIDPCMEIVEKLKGKDDPLLANLINVKKGLLQTYPA